MFAELSYTLSSIIMSSDQALPNGFCRPKRSGRVPVVSPIDHLTSMRQSVEGGKSFFTISLDPIDRGKSHITRDLNDWLISLDADRVHRLSNTAEIPVEFYDARSETNTRFTFIRQPGAYEKEPSTPAVSRSASMFGLGFDEEGLPYTMVEMYDHAQRRTEPELKELGGTFRRTTSTQRIVGSRGDYIDEYEATDDPSIRVRIERWPVNESDKKFPYPTKLTGFKFGTWSDSPDDPQQQVTFFDRYPQTTVCLVSCASLPDVER